MIDFTKMTPDELCDLMNSTQPPPGLLQAMFTQTEDRE